MYSMNNTGPVVIIKTMMKKCVVLQVNDAAVRLRLVVFVSKVQGFYRHVQITEQTGWGEGR